MLSNSIITLMFSVFTIDSWTDWAFFSPLFESQVFLKTYSFVLFLLVYIDWLNMVLYSRNIHIAQYNCTCQRYTSRVLSHSVVVCAVIPVTAASVTIFLKTCLVWFLSTVHFLSRSAVACAIVSITIALGTIFLKTFLVLFLFTVQSLSRSAVACAIVSITTALVAIFLGTFAAIRQQIIFAMITGVCFFASGKLSNNGVATRHHNLLTIEGWFMFWTRRLVHGLWVAILSKCLMSAWWLVNDLLSSCRYSTCCTTVKTSLSK